MSLQSACLFVCLLGILSGCATGPKQDLKVKTSLMPYADWQQLKEGQRQILDKTKAEIVAEYGKPEEIQKLEVNGQMRERYSYHVIEKDFLQRKLLLDIYFVKDVVVGYNIYSGERPAQAAQGAVNMTDKFVFGAL